MLRLVGLIRVSTEKQAEDNGLDRQRSAIEAIAKAHMAELRVVELKGVSGPYVADDPAWQGTILPSLKQGWHLAVDAIDRLIRADRFDLRVLQDIQQIGAKVYTPNGVQDFGRSQDTLLATILAGLGGFEKAEIKRRMMGGRVAARRAGKAATGAHAMPTGILYDRDTGWAIEPVGADRVRRAFEGIARGESLSFVSQALGCQPPSISRWIENPVYRGCLSARWGSLDLGQETRVFAEDEAVVSEATWRAANTRLRASHEDARKRRASAAPGIWASSYLFSDHEQPTGMVRFGGVQDLDGSKYCKHVLYGRSSKSKSNAYLCRCSYPMPRWVEKLEPCGLKALRADRTNAALDRYLDDLTHDASVAKAIRAAFAVPARDTKAERTRVEKSLAELDKREARLVDLHLDGAMSRAVYDSKRAGIERDRKALQGELASLDAQKGPSADDLTALVASWAWDPSWPPARKREWLARYVPGGIQVSNEGIMSAMVRVPFPEGAVDFRVADGRSWDDLIGISALASVHDPKPAGCAAGMTTREVSAFLGVPHSSFLYAVAHGTVPKPALLAGRYYCWMPAEVEAARQALTPRTHPAAAGRTRRA